MPHAINAGIFGMIMPDRNVPNFWTATRVPPLAGVEVSTAVMIDSSH
jgi:hypothetical protein